jgi:hypothetical protein
MSAVSARLKASMLTTASAGLLRAAAGSCRPSGVEGGGAGRFLGDAIATSTLEDYGDDEDMRAAFEALFRALFARGGDRARSLDYSNSRLQVARHLARMARELNLLSEESAVYLARLQVDLGNQVGSWRKALVVTGNSSEPSVTPSI